jgi:hypothetical protein
VSGIVKIDLLLKTQTMEKNIKDYLHLYMGCKCHTPDGIMELSYVKDGSNWPVWFDEKCNEANSEILSNYGCCAKGYKYNQVKPILRPLSDMTEEEKNELLQVDREYTSANILPNIPLGRLLVLHYTERQAQITRYLLSKHFDLFGLIPAGLAIDATKQEVKQ